MVAQRAADPWRGARPPVSRRLDIPTSVWVAVAVLAGVVVPAASFAWGSPWPTVALPVLVAAAAWCGRRAVHQARGAVEQAQRQVESIAVHDELTGCANDAGLRLFGTHLVHAAQRRGDALHACVVDVKDLGRVNDLLGRAAGDEVLVAVADAVRSCTRGTDVVARGHSDEFVVVGPGTGVHAGELERRVRAHLVETPPAPLEVWPCRVTVGQAVLEPWDDGDLDGVVTRAYQDLQLRAAMRAPSAPEPPLTTAG